MRYPPRILLILSFLVPCSACGPGEALEDEVGGESTESTIDDEGSSSSSSSSSSSESSSSPSTSIDGGIDSNWGEGPGETSQPHDEPHGLTWRIRDIDRDLDIVMLGSDEQSDPYIGDTPCTTALPIACIAPLGLPNPGVPEDDYYHGWTGGTLGMTPPVIGSEITSLETADALCVAALGPDYRMAEHHDGGGGWNWWAHATDEVWAIAETDARWWVHIDDQPGNCWNWSP